MQEKESSSANDNANPTGQLVMLGVDFNYPLVNYCAYNSLERERDREWEEIY